MGARAVRHRQARRDPRQHQPGLPHATRSSTCLRQSGCRMADRRADVQDQRLPGDGRRGPAGLADLERVLFLDTPSGTQWLGPWVTASSADCDERRADPRRSTTRSTSSTRSGTTGFPKGATLTHHNILNNGFFVGRGLRLHASSIGCASRCRSTTASAWCWAISRCTTHGATMVFPAAAFEPLATLQAIEAERCTSLYGVPTMFIAELGASAFRRVRPVVAAHRHHGRLTVPGRGDEAGDVGDAHGRGDHLLRHDRDLAGVHADRCRRHHRAARRHGRACASARRDPGRRSADRQARASAA